jgi:hypothetical protein
MRLPRPCCVVVVLSSIFFPLYSNFAGFVASYHLIFLEHTRLAPGGACLSPDYSQAKLGSIIQACFVFSLVIRFVDLDIITSIESARSFLHCYS